MNTRRLVGCSLVLGVDKLGYDAASACELLRVAVHLEHKLVDVARERGESWRGGGKEGMMAFVSTVSRDADASWAVSSTRAMHLEHQLVYVARDSGEPWYRGGWQGGGRDDGVCQ